MDSTTKLMRWDHDSGAIREFLALIKGTPSALKKKGINLTFIQLKDWSLCQKVEHILCRVSFKFFKNTLFRLANCFASYAMFVTNILQRSWGFT